MEDRVPARLTFTASEGRKFAFPVGIAFAVLGGILLWRRPGGLFGTPVALWMVFFGFAVALFIGGTVAPQSLGPVYRGWMGFAHLLSKITTPIFMGVVYFLVITPIGLFMRLIGRQPMHHKVVGGSLWMDPPSGGRSDMEHQF